MKHQASLFLYGVVYLLTAFGVVSAGQQSADTGFCKVSSLPVDPSNALEGIGLSPSSFFGITREYSTASIELVNVSSMSIDRIALIVEYLDASDKVVLRIPFYATSTDEDLPQPPFPLPPSQVMDKAVAPNEHIVLVGSNPLISSVCPTKGHIIFERAWFSNGTAKNFASSLDSDIFPDVLPAYFDTSGCRLSVPVDVLVRLKIKPSGESDVVSLEGGTRVQFACLSREMRHWIFLPAIQRGTPVESEAEILLRFHPKERFPSDTVASQFLRKTASSSMSVVHLTQSEDNVNHWNIFYAGGCCTRTVRSRELYREQ